MLATFSDYKPDPRIDRRVEGHSRTKRSYVHGDCEYEWGSGSSGDRMKGSVWGEGESEGSGSHASRICLIAYFLILSDPSHSHVCNLILEKGLDPAPSFPRRNESFFLAMS